jgi:PKD repeat protein
MKALTLAFVLSLTAAGAYAVSACTQPAPANTSISYFGFDSNCATNNSLACTPNETMVFSAIPNGYSFGCEGHTFLWDFGDTTIGSGINVFHTFTAPGTYVVKLTLTSELSQTLVLTQTINVFPAVPAIDRRALIALALAIIAIAFVRLR